MKQIGYILIFLAVILLTLAAQTKNCEYCGKPITKKFLVVDNKYFHPEHFLCAYCSKPIEGMYNSKDGKYYHPNCYVESEIPKCSVCGNPLTGKYIKDSYGNQYHESHEREYQHCDNCYRLICTKITNGGVKYNDGRNICNLCFKNSVQNNELFPGFMMKVINSLRDIGLELKDRNISIAAVDRKKLKTIAGDSYSVSMRGFSNIQSETVRKGRTQRSTSSYTIYILSGAPREYIESTIAHELMHIWLYQNTHNEHASELEEGSCNFISYLYLKKVNSKIAEEIISQLMNDPDPVYGNGFRKVHKLFGGRYLVELLNFLKAKYNF